MACYHPIAAWKHKTAKNDNGKSVITFHLPLTLSDYEEIRVPCGQCVGCRLDYSRDWATRIMCECKSWEQNWFVTLTYDPEHVPVSSVVDTETGEFIQGMTLVPSHLTKFMKDLRRYWEYHYDHTGIRFYACGEYGDESGRPHYHLAIFNLPFAPDQLEPWFFNKEHQQIYKCPVLEQIWANGIVAVGEVTFNSAAYIARYMLKKQKGPDAAAFYRSQGKAPEFSRMSRRPGIGADYYAQHRDEIYEHDEMFMGTLKKVMKVKPPKYFDRLYDMDSPEAMAAIKEDRAAVAKAASAAMLSKTTLREDELNRVRERSVIERTNSLLRSVD